LLKYVDFEIGRKNFVEIERENFVEIERGFG